MYAIGPGVSRVFGIAVLSALPIASSAAPEYAITDLGTLGGYRSVPNSINQRGDVVGVSWLPGDISYHAFLFNGKAMVDLGTLGGANSGASGINDLGQVVGYADTADGASHAFLRSGGAMVDLGLSGSTASAASAINNKSQIAVSSGSWGLLYEGGTATDVGTLGGCCVWPSAINNLGQLVGTGTLPGNSIYHAFLYDGGTLRDIGSLNRHSWGLGINDFGAVVGSTDTSSGIHAFLYSGGSMTDLGALGGEMSQAQGINNKGQIVGEFMSRTGYRAFLRDSRGMVDINDLIDPDSPWTVEIGNAVNDAGQIAAWGCEKTGLACHALLLNPVPEPDTLALFVAGLGMLGWASRKRHSLS